MTRLNKQTFERINCSQNTDIITVLSAVIFITYINPQTVPPENLHRLALKSCKKNTYQEVVPLDKNVN